MPMKSDMISRLQQPRDEQRVRVLLAATGSVAAMKLPQIAQALQRNTRIELQVVATERAKHFFDVSTVETSCVHVWSDKNEWETFRERGDPVLHIELRKWADVLVIAPLSANFLAKIANGICDCLLSSVVRAWDFRKPLLLAPAMNTLMWESPLTTQHLAAIRQHGRTVSVIDPIQKMLMCGDTGIGAMAEWGDCLQEIEKAVDSILVERLGQKLSSQQPEHQQQQQSNESNENTNLDTLNEGDEFPSLNQNGHCSMLLHIHSRFHGHEEYQYLDLIRAIIDHGEERVDRTGVGTLAYFCPPQLRFSLRNNKFPLLTTKRTFFRGITEELLWFIRGDTNAKHLADKNVHIWDGNGSREFLDNLGFIDRQEGDLGPVYGFQWRHFGAKYVNCNTNYDEQGVDQLANVIKKIKNSPFDRRIIMSAWNAADLSKMALPPCHILCQFYVSQKSNEVSCLLFQRSCDMGLGVPFNIASYALLLRMIAHVCGRNPGELAILMGDCHIYKNHILALEEQLKREPREFPTLEFTRNVGSIDDFTVDDIILKNYKPHPKLAMEMAV